ncbi:MAG: DedA family protein [Lentilitoribacter sp.]
MTDVVLNLIPQYGLYLVFLVVMLACFGIPLPSSVVVLTSGALAAAGDLTLWQVIFAVALAYTIGDQAAFLIARFLGPNLLIKLKDIQSITSTIDRSEAMLEKHGWLAILLSRTIVSPTGPYIAYVSGAVRMNWIKFTTVALPASILWTLAYAMIGYLFAGNLPQISDLVASMLIVGIASISAMAFAAWLTVLWRKFEID